MVSKDFFRDSIKDNNYQGISLKDNITPSFHDDIYHHKKRNKAKFREEGIANYIKGLHKNLASKNIAELNLSLITFDEEYDANQDQKLFEISGDSFNNLKIHTGNIVGSIVQRSTVFNINSRFGNGFLQYMIANTSGFLELENMGAINANIGLGEWVLIYYWKLQLKKAFSLGIYKTYEEKKESLSSVRGSIDINSYIKKSYFDGKTVCKFKEHSYKNELNAVINLALEKTFKSKYHSLVADIYEIKKAFASINNSEFNFRNVQNLRVANPYFKRYDQVFDLSLKILNDEFANVGESNSDFSAFLFDVSLLFEHHIRKLLKQSHSLFPKNKREFGVPNGIYENSIFPDVIIDYGNNNIGVYDVKYKNYNFADGVNRDDRFQLITYVAMHLGKYNVIECGIIYPLSESNLDQISKTKQQMIRIGNKEIRFNIKFYMIAENIHNQIEMDKSFLKSFQEPPQSPEVNTNFMEKRSNVAREIQLSEN